MDKLSKAPPHERGRVHLRRQVRRARRAHLLHVQKEQKRAHQKAEDKHTARGFPRRKPAQKGTGGQDAPRRGKRMEKLLRKRLRQTAGISQSRPRQKRLKATSTQPPRHPAGCFYGEFAAKDIPHHEGEGISFAAFKYKECAK